MEYVLIFGLGLIAGTLGGIIGTGSSLIMLPLLVVMYGPKFSVPIMAIASIMANIGRLATWWRDVRWREFAIYASSGIPASILGARTLISMPEYVADFSLGIFFVCLLPARYFLKGMRVQGSYLFLFVCGALIGFMTGIVQSTGPLSVVIFSIFGLSRGILLATEAATSLAIYSSKTSTFGFMGVLNEKIITRGCLIGASLIAGAFSGKAIIAKFTDLHLNLVLDIVILSSGSLLLVSAAKHYF